MTGHAFSGLFVAEGTSDMPLATIVESMFFERGVSLRLSSPDFSLLGARIGKDVESRVKAGVELIGVQPDVVVVHRDSDNVDPGVRRIEIEQGVRSVSGRSMVVPVIPIRMTEAWLLMDENAIRTVAGNPNGKIVLNLPKMREVESRADPKALLSESILKASELTGRRREKLAKRFAHNRRQLLEKLDTKGTVTGLFGWNALLGDVERVIATWKV